MKTSGCYITSMAPIIALFDIDGTLLRAGGAGRRAVELALADVVDELGANVGLESVEFAGRTDPWIVRTALTQYGVEADDALIGAVLERYVEHLPRELELASAFEVLPGVSSLLSKLSALAHVTLGLGTGNTERAAYAKLARGGLEGFFSFGGFGSDHTDRAELLRAGRDRGLQRVGALHAGVEVVVIGDTPHDVAAAQAIGAYCVAVSTGSYDGASLRDAGANVVVEDLLAPEVEAAFVVGRGG
jgi:phosphoglycolate phosphatase-like HAD superfamily hydrolase